MSWTEQQRNAINARNSSIIVSAAAGSGKTAVLTERLADLIADPCSGVRADRIIVVTFTNDAAAELKKRLDVKLRGLINDDPGNSHLLKQQVLLQSARISTINSFCFELIRDNITDQGVTAGFAILDETDNSVLRMQAMDDLFNYYSSAEYEKISFLYDRFCVKNEKQLAEVITLIDNFLNSVAMRDKWLDNAADEYRKDFKESIYFGCIISYAVEKLKRAIRISENCCGYITKIFPDMSASAAQKSLMQAESDYDKISTLLKIFSSGRYPTSEEAEAASDFSDLVRVGKAVHNKKLREIYKRCREQYKKLVTEALDSISSVKSDFAESAEVTSVLAEVIRKYHEIIWEKKCAKNALGFDDGERLALELLADIDEKGRIVQSETALSTSEFYDVIMIDEYQDSNNKQDLIFKLISRNFKHNPDGEPMYGDNVFLVGDVKQSIYRFRLANPRNFIKTLKSSEPYDSESCSSNKSIVLNRNFRSSKGVISFVNFVFGKIMTEKCGDIYYTKKEQLFFGAQCYLDAEEENIRTEIVFINDDPDEDAEEESAPKTFKKNINREAEFTAKKISDMLKNGTDVIEPDGKKRACRPSDFCILVRNNAFVKIYSEALEACGVPVRETEETGYLKSREIAILLDLLRIISNPLLEVSMTAVMTSPMYMFDVGEVAYLKSLDRGRPLFSIMKTLIDEGDYECSDMFLIGRCREFLNSLDGFRLDSVTMTIGELIRKIYDTTDFISVMQLQSNGEKKRANLRALIQYASGYEASAAFEGSGGLSGFLRHTDRIIASGDYSHGKSSAISGDYVSVQTLHSSKGLEYPFVFIAETSCRFKYDSKSVMCSDDGRIGYIFYDPKIYRRYKTFQQILLSDEARRDTRSEEMRLFYVGLTRAKQKLFINLKCGEKSLKRVCAQLDSVAINGGDIEEAVCGADCFADWLWLCIIGSSEFNKIAERLNISAEMAMPVSSTHTDKIFSAEFAETFSDYENFEEKQKIYAEADDEICKEIRSMIGSSYDSSLSKIPSKLSVTQITKKFDNEESDFDFSLKRPKFISNESKLTGSERGTALHTFFQYCDFGEAIAEPAAEIMRIARMGYITSAQAASISIDNVAAFFQSDLYSRIRKAKKVWREKKFMVSISQLKIKNIISERFDSSDGMIKGIIDLMFEDENGIVIVDYKSDRGVSADKLKKRYNVQLSLYCSAIELITGKKVSEAYLYSFELKSSLRLEI